MGPNDNDERALGLLADALRDVGGVDAAFVFGSTSRGTARPDSDIDVIVVGGPGLDRRTLLRQLADAALEIGREVNTLIYTREQLAERLLDPTHPAHRWACDVVSGPTRQVAGGADALTWLERLRDAAGRL